MEIEKQKAIIEAILFAAGRVIKINELMGILELSSDDVVTIIDSMKEEYKNSDRGIEIIRVEDGYQLTTKKEMYEYLYPIFDKRSKPNLTQASMETLAIIAYNPKITRAEIEAIRDFTLEVERSKNVLGFSKKHIFNTREDNSLILDIDLSRNSESCDCVICNYRNFRFDKLVSKLKSAEGNPNFINAEYAFGNFLVSSNDYKTSYIILKILQNQKNQRYFSLLI